MARKYPMFNNIVASVSIIFLNVLLASCGSSSSSSTHSATANSIGSSTQSSGFNFRAITNNDIDSVNHQWQNRYLDPQDVEIVREVAEDSYIVKIIKHTVLGNDHYGAIAVPNSSSTEKIPVVVLPDGLNQLNPTINIDTVLGYNQGQDNALAPFIQVIPAFRGRTLIFQGSQWFAQGDFCDAYDGAADDSIALLNVAEQLVPQGNYDKVLVWGGSRGGNNALLLGVRDPRINTVLAAAAPVDFYRDEVLRRYGSQYRCQYLTGKTETESRQRMLASSPLYFEQNLNVQTVFLFHGTQDTVVPVWNIHEMTAKLRLQSPAIQVEAFLYEGHSHGSFYGDAEHIEKLLQGINQFKNNLNAN